MAQEKRLVNPDSEPGKCDVVISHTPKGLRHFCKKCKKVLATGYFTVVIIVEYPQEIFRYILGKTPPEMCCGEDALSFYLFNSAEEAQVKANEAVREINLTLDTKSLRLLSVIETIKGCESN